MSHDLTPNQVRALQEFARQHGRRWKSKLRMLWYRGKDEGVLRQIRNELGPQGLIKWKLPKATADQGQSETVSSSSRPEEGV